MRRSPLVSLLIVVACSSNSKPVEKPAADAPRYRATIERTAYGVPHIQADDLGSVFFGQGYAFAEDHACLFADQIVKIRSERARWFGRGADDANVSSDFGWLHLGVRKRAADALPALSADVREMVRGWAAGYDEYLATRAGELPPDCAGKPWVTPIDETDVVAYGLSVMLVASSGYFVDEIGSAAPRRAGKSGAIDPDWDSIDLPSAAASNGWAIGAERSASAGGLLLANPHYPWEGAMKFYESHLTLPGRFDVYGVAALGNPGIAIGFNDRVAWTYTYSASSRWTLFRVVLDPADPTRYRHGGATKEMTASSYVIQVKQPDGSLVDERRTLYATHHGPMLGGGGPLGWDADRGVGFAIQDANRDNRAFADQMLAMLAARDVADLRSILARHSAVPFLNIVAADREGNVLYADASQVPDLSKDALAKWSLGLLAIKDLAAAWKRGIVILDGSDPIFDWSGPIPFDRAPQMIRRDWVINANDDAWLANPAQPLTGHSRLYGDVETGRTLRTRMNMVVVGGGDRKLTLDDVKDAALSNRAMAAELLLDEVRARCRKEKPAGDAGAACAALDGWDGRLDLDAAGAIVWRELVASFDWSDLTDEGELFREPFDPADPVGTPRGLAERAPLARRLGEAAKNLREAGIDPKTRLGDVQRTRKNDRLIPIHGGIEQEGATNIVGYNDGLNLTLYPPMRRGEVVNAATGLARDGYIVNYGTSFLLAVELTDGGVRAEAILTYSGSSDPRSPHHADQTELFSRKRWRPVLFRDAEIASDPSLRRRVVAAERREPIGGSSR